MIDQITGTGYSLSDFLLFSPEAYFRQYELANSDLWPMQLPLMLCAALVFWYWRRQHPHVLRWASLLLAASCVLSGGVFLSRHYAQINPVAGWFAWGFFIQAALLFLLMRKLFRQQSKPSVECLSFWHPGILLSIYALAIHPLVGLIAGRSWPEIELFAVSPDATALVIVGFLLTGSLRRTWPLLVVPLMWCLFSALTYLAMELFYGVLPLLLAVIALTVTFGLGRVRVNN